MGSSTRPRSARAAWPLALVVLLAACSGAHARGREEYQGVVELSSRSLGFELGGRLAEVGVAEGDDVVAGAPLASLDSELATLAVAARQAELDAARARTSLLEAGARGEEIRGARAEWRASLAATRQLEADVARQQTLQASGASNTAQGERLSAQLEAAQQRSAALNERVRALRSGARPQEIEAAEAGTRAAEQGLAAARRQLELHRLEAPLSGTILDVNADPGEVVGPGVPVITMADLSRPYVEVFVPQARLTNVQLGASVSVRVDGLATPLVGQVEHIGRRLEFTPRFLFSERERPNLVMRVRVRIDDEQHLLHAGVPAFATLSPSATPSPASEQP